jgi:hypothetical protein
MKQQHRPMITIEQGWAKYWYSILRRTVCRNKRKEKQKYINKRIWSGNVVEHRLRWNITYCEEWLGCSFRKSAVAFLFTFRKQELVYLPWKEQLTSQQLSLFADVLCLFSPCTGIVYSILAPVQILYIWSWHEVRNVSPVTLYISVV